MEIQDEVVKGGDAERLLENPIFKDSFVTVRENIVNSMARSPLGDTQTHHNLVIALQVLDQIEKALKDVINTGKMAELQIKEKKFNIFG